MRNFYKILCMLGMMFSTVSLQASTAQSPVVASEYVVGDPNAPITIYNYSSLTCHVCAGFYKGILPKILEDFKGKIKVVVRPFPFNALDIAGAKMILHSKSPHKLSDRFYETQETWLGAKNQLEVMKKVAKDFGMPDQEIKQSLENEKLENAMLAKRLILKTSSAPVFKVGKSILDGMPHPNHFKKLLESLVYHVIERGQPIEDFDAYKEFDKMAEENAKDEKVDEKK